MRSKKPYLLILAGLLMLFFSFYGSAASVTTSMEREVEINLSNLQPPEPDVLIEAVPQEGQQANQYRLTAENSSQTVFSIKNNSSKPLTVTVEVGLTPYEFMNPEKELNGNHWRMGMLDQRFHHKNLSGKINFTVEPHSEKNISTEWMDSGNSSGKDVTLTADMTIQAGQISETFVHHYHLIYGK